MSFKPYGELSDGSYGIPLDSSNNQTVAAIEILASLPATDAPANFPGRTVFSTGDLNVFTFYDDEWIPLKTGQVGVGTPTPTTPDVDGTLYYATSNGVLYICVGGVWIGIAGNIGTGVVWRHYVADGVTSLYDTGSGQMPPVDYVQVFIDGEAMQPGSNGVRDYYMVGNNVQLNATPSTSAKISIRTLLFTNPTINSSFAARRYTTNGSDNSFDTGSQLLVAGQTMVTIDGVVQVVDTGGGNGTYDYKIATQNNTISSLTRVGTTCTATTASEHGYSNGETITIVGATQTDYNGTFTIVSTPTTTSFTYTALNTPSASPATGSPRFGPLKTNDRIVFYDSSGNAAAPASGSVVYIQTVRNLFPSY